ncbi:hypothetical protein QYF36_010118 [Acer negundo]|nr:hypothetical protein QYF36_010118 [Acer negundo]
MAGGTGDRSLKETPTWAVALVCAGFVIISILIEHGILSIGKLFQRKQKKAMTEALEKIKSELMLLGFMSLLITVGTKPISKICIPASAGDIMLPCKKDSKEEDSHEGGEDNQRKLLLYGGDVIWRRGLASAGGDDYCFKSGKVPLVSQTGIHQLHIFIFVLAVIHVLYSVVTIGLAKAKMKKWKSWESETTSLEYQFSNDPSRFRLTHQTSFVRRHTGIFAAPGLRWIILLIVGAKLETIIMEMAQQIQDRTTVVKGALTVEPSNTFFWFNRPDLILFLIHLTLFQNSFQMAYFLWTWYEFGLFSCYTENVPEMFTRVIFGLVLQILCSYITFPLYSLVTQMGSHMKKAIFEEQTAKALKNWQKAAKQRKKQRSHGGTYGGNHSSSFMSGENTPSPSQGSSSPLYLLHKFRQNQIDLESAVSSPSRSNYNYQSETELSEMEMEMEIETPEHRRQHDNLRRTLETDRADDFSFVKP